jgi:FAD/FMN-containing dehydrogenase
MAMTVARATSALRTALAAVVGDPHVLDSEVDRRFFSQDVYRSSRVPVALVVAPGTVDELARAVRAITDAGHAVVPRGGGASYTGGYLADREEAVVVDTRRLNRIVEVNIADMYVVVEAGCTWQALAEALAAARLRTPFWGPLSGAYATVGGSLSQNAILWGSARYGPSADSVLGLEVVLADGRLVRTGSWGTAGGTPFFRSYGADLSGLFLCDTGAFGIKARAALRLMPAPVAVESASFSFDSATALTAAMSAVARSGLATECFGMDPVLQRQRMKRAGLAQDVQALRGVVSSAANLASGLTEAARVVAAGRRFLDDVPYSVHLGAEAHSAVAARDQMAGLRAICGAHGREIENTIPKVLRGMPYVSMTSAIGPAGERWAPIHAVVPLSSADGVWRDVQAVLDRHADRMAAHEVLVGVLTATVSTTAFVIEPVCYWPGPRPSYYDRYIDAATLSRFTTFQANTGTEALVTQLRAEILDVFARARAAHLQIGRTYPFLATREPTARALLEAIKTVVDPHGLMNPGSLGFAARDRGPRE